MSWRRRLPVGAECMPGGGVHFRVWAPDRNAVEVRLEETDRIALAAEPEGYFSVSVPRAAAGMQYGYLLDHGDQCFPDPASRSQPQGPHGLSVVVDPATYRWQHDKAWRGLPSPELRVLYELHVGTFTPEGTFQSAARELSELARAGINVIEVMPIAEFGGRFGWGYDGVDLFAPSHLYGTPDDVRHFVDAAHAAGIAVILDVVYNHFGPDGCYLAAYTGRYFSKRYENDWGAPINFDGSDAKPVREYFTSNAAYWIDEFHLDGLRLDATQQIFDSSACNIIAEIVQAARSAAGGRELLILCENEPQDAKLVRDAARGGFGADAMWNDDFHHSAMVALTGHSEAYYSDYAGSAQELVSSAQRGFLYQGQFSRWQKDRRGTPATDLPPKAFVHFLENHDQVANSARGARLAARTSPGRYRALTTLLLLGPQMPMLFQGQEFASSRPFLYFADHEGELAASVREGRQKFLAQFPSIATPGIQGILNDPSDRSTFERCKLDFSERVSNAAAYCLHLDLIRLRQSDPAFSKARARPIDGCVLNASAFALRFALGASTDRLLLINLGHDLILEHAAEPLLAPPDRRGWRTLWSSEDQRYGGGGIVECESGGRFFLPGEAAIVLGAGGQENTRDDRHVEDESAIAHAG